MKHALFLTVFTLCAWPHAAAQTASADSASRAPRLQLGGYGEAVYARHFYSDNIYRYQNPAKYKNDPAHGRIDIPHAVIYLGYDFGRGWRMGCEIEFEHGGTGTAFEQEYEEAGEWEQEVERGGEVALEQFWIEKTFRPWLNVRAGHIVVPVGLTNAHHEPLQFFTVYRPEGERLMLPCTWHQTGLSFWGKAGKWRYELQVLAGLDAMNFSRDHWIQGGAASAFEFSTANKPALAARLDWQPLAGLRLGVSGYWGRSMHNSSPHDLEGTDELGVKKKHSDLKGTVTVAAADLTYRTHHWLVRASGVYGHLGDAAAISQIKKNLTSNKAPTDKSYVGERAYCYGVEAGYNVLGPCRKPRVAGQQLYLFARYDESDTYLPAAGMQDYKQTLRRTLTAGLNYLPIRQIGIKAEYAHTWLRSPLNNEPTVALGIVYQGFFTR